MAGIGQRPAAAARASWPLRPGRTAVGTTWRCTSSWTSSTLVFSGYGAVGPRRLSVLYARSYEWPHGGCGGRLRCPNGGQLHFEWLGVSLDFFLDESLLVLSLLGLRSAAAWLFTLLSSFSWRWSTAVPLRIVLGRRRSISLLLGGLGCWSFPLQGLDEVRLAALRGAPWGLLAWARGWHSQRGLQLPRAVWWSSTPGLGTRPATGSLRSSRLGARIGSRFAGCSRRTWFGACTPSRRRPACTLPARASLEPLALAADAAQAKDPA